MNLFDVLILQPIFNALMVLYSLVPGGDFGVAVILFTILIRILMWPLIKKQLHQVKAMRKLQPELVQIKKKAKGNRQLEGMMMLELYKKHNVNPFRTIGILLIQLPIFIGLYHVIRIFTEHRDELAQFAYGVVENIPSVSYLIDNPDTFNQYLFGVVDLTQHAINFQTGAISPFLVFLAVAAGFLQYVSSKQTMPQQSTGEKKGLRQIMAEAADGKPDQSELNAVVMQKMVKVLPLIMVVVMVNLPGAIALYYAVSTAVAVLQQHILLQRDEEELEELADVAEKMEEKKKAKKRAEKAKKAEVVADTPVIAKKTSKESKKKKASAKATVRVVATPSKKGKNS